MSFGLQKHSEFLGHFNYFLMKQTEHGISARIFRRYHIPLYVKEEFGLKEPQPLGYEHVMPLFILLGLGMSASLAIAIVEFLTSKLVKGAPPPDFDKKKLDSDMHHRQAWLVTKTNDNDRVHKSIYNMPNS